MKLLQYVLISLLGISNLPAINPGKFCAREFEDKKGILWHPYLEWKISNVSFQGNPFDLEARATFTHLETGSTITTGMFYVGNDTWKFRFTGTRTGKWAFITSSANKDLNGHKGSVFIKPNMSKKIYGFKGKCKKDVRKWGRQKGKKGEYEAILPHYVMWHEADDIDTTEIDEDIDLFLKKHGFTGFHIPVKEPDLWTDGTNPRPGFFRRLEKVLVKIHAAGGISHLWLWGDAQRGQIPPGGANSKKDKRLQRYICARLACIPGWSAGYGFDLFEWTNKTKLNEWYRYMHRHMGWDHYLGARADKNEYNQFSEIMDYSSYELHKYAEPQPWYQQWVKVVNERPDKPAFSEDRFRVRGKYPDKDVTPEETRKGLYYSTMAGGAASIWGYLKYEDGDYKSGGRSFVYPNKEQIKTWSVFFNEKNRFLKDMVRANDLSNGYVLHSPSTQSYVVYKENTTSIRLHMTVTGKVPVVAVNTKKAYKEIDLGNHSSGKHTFELPGSSDWVIAVGRFDK